jgi:uncharacterized protein (TIGR02594 family)
VQYKTRWDGLDSLVGDKNPWCAAFVNYCLKEKGYSPSKRFSSSFSFEEDKDRFVEIKKPIYGAIRFTLRSGGGHVCLVYGKTTEKKLISVKGEKDKKEVQVEKIIVLGGNQGDQIKFETPDGTKGLRYFIPVSYGGFSEKELLLELPEVDIFELRSVFGLAAKNLKTSSYV